MHMHVSSLENSSRNDFVQFRAYLFSFVLNLLIASDKAVDLPPDQLEKVSIGLYHVSGESRNLLCVVIVSLPTISDQARAL